MSKLSTAFVNARRSFGPALKDKTNPAFRSKYADLGACIDAVDDALLANGIALIQDTFEDATGVTVETVFLHESGEERRCGKLHVPAAKQDPQGYGSALTYARRYSLLAACGIAPEDDDGNAGVLAKTEQAARAARRAQWLKDQYALINSAKTAGDLKRIVEEAVSVAIDESDDDAAELIREAGITKAKTAQKPTSGKAGQADVYRTAETPTKEHA